MPQFYLTCMHLPVRWMVIPLSFFVFLTQSSHLVRGPPLSLAPSTLALYIFSTSLSSHSFNVSMTFQDWLKYSLIQLVPQIASCSNVLISHSAPQSDSSYWPQTAHFKNISLQINPVFISYISLSCNTLIIAIPFDISISASVIDFLFFHVYLKHLQPLYLHPVCASIPLSFFHSNYDSFLGTEKQHNSSILSPINCTFNAQYSPDFDTFNTLILFTFTLSFLLP